MTKAALVYPHVARGEEYARAVLAGEIRVGRLTRLCIERQARDLARQGTPEFPYEFDRAKAERVCKFKSLMPHVKGGWAKRGERFALQGWQCWATSVLFGWVRKGTGLRRFAEAFTEVPRKNGKSFDAAATANYMLAADGEFGAEVYTGATDEHQAWEVFRPAREMAIQTPAFCNRYGIEVNSAGLLIPADNSRLEPVVGKPGDGSSPSCAIIDEFHEHLTPALYDTMALGMGAREQPLLYVVTTAGTSLSGPCYQRHLYAVAVLEGRITDEQFFTLIYAADADDDWSTLATAQKANPNYGVSILPDRLERDLAAAVRSAYLQNAYKTKRLNIWCGAKAAWMNMTAWEACPAPPKRTKLKGKKCFAGVDLGITNDPSAICYLFPPEKRDGIWYVYWDFYLPEDSARVGNNAADYAAWSKMGFLNLTHGNVTDFDRLEHDMVEAKKLFRIESVGYDPFQAAHFASDLTEKSLPMVKVPQSMQYLSEPMKLVERMVLSGKLAHGNNPVANWMMGNVTTKENVRGDVYPNKNLKDPDSKIDGVMALLNAANRAFAALPKGNFDEWLNAKV
jgi:phage terminase large subunit-like protein